MDIIQYIETKYNLAGGKQIFIEIPMDVNDLLEQAKRKISSQKRQSTRRDTEYIDGVTDTTKVLPQEDFADIVHRTELNRQLYAAIEKLSDIQRRRVYLYYFKQLTCRQIADLESVSFKTVSRSLVRALKKLKESLTI